MPSSAFHSRSVLIINLIKKGFVLSVDSRDKDYSTLLSKIQLNDTTSCWKGNPGSSRLLP